MTPATTVNDPHIIFTNPRVGVKNLGEYTVVDERGRNDSCTATLTVVGEDDSRRYYGCRVMRNTCTLENTERHNLYTTISKVLGNILCPHSGGYKPCTPILRIPSSIPRYTWYEVPIRP